jgi:hypothetical protein
MKVALEFDSMEDAVWVRDMAEKAIALRREDPPYGKQLPALFASILISTVSKAASVEIQEELP